MCARRFFLPLPIHQERHMTLHNGHEILQKKCKQCGRNFEAWGKMKFCSDPCSKKYFSEKYRDRWNNGFNITVNYKRRLERKLAKQGEEKCIDLPSMENVPTVVS